MRGKLLLTFAAGLLASTALAFGQGATERKDKAQPGASPPAATQGQPGQPNVQKEQPKPSTSGQAQEKREQAPKGAQAPTPTPKGAQGPTPKTPDQNRTQGQNQREQPKTQGQAPRNPGETRTPSQAQPAPGNQPTPGQNQPGRTQGQNQPSGGGTSVTLTTEQRTKIRTTVIEGRNAPRVSRVDFSVNVGTVIPRTVHVIEVPQVIVEVHPEWRGFLYFVYNDEIIIVERRTLKIVAVLTV